MNQKRSIVLNWVLPGIAAIVVAAIVLAWQWPRITSTPEGNSSQPVLAADTATQPFAFGNTQTNTGLAQSAQHVRVTALRHGNSVTTQIAIDKGWHINTNPASLKFLIPTALSLSSEGSPLAITVDYPQGHTIDVGLEQPIRVFSNRVKITAQAENASADAPIQAVVRVQACSNKGRCLAPSTVKLQALNAGS